MKTAIVLLANGFEEVEAITPINYLNQAGVKVTVVAIGNNLNVIGMHGITISADILLQDLIKQHELVDAIIIPGGTPGAQNIAASKEASTLIIEMASTRKLICAISDSPVIILAPLGLLSDKTFTCFPGMENQIQNANWIEERVAIDDNIITSRSPGTAGEFTIAIIKQLLDETQGERIAKKVLIMADC